MIRPSLVIVLLCLCAAQMAHCKKVSSLEELILGALSVPEEKPVLLSSYAEEPTVIVVKEVLEPRTVSLDASASRPVMMNSELDSMLKQIIMMFSDDVERASSKGDMKRRMKRGTEYGQPQSYAPQAAAPPPPAYAPPPVAAPPPPAAAYQEYQAPVPAAAAPAYAPQVAAPPPPAAAYQEYQAPAVAAPPPPASYAPQPQVSEPAPQQEYGAAPPAASVYGQQPPMAKLPNNCVAGAKVEPIWEGTKIYETYCRCGDGRSYHATCASAGANPCGDGAQYHPADASMGPQYFVECSWGVPFVFKCPANLVWNQQILVCDWPPQPQLALQQTAAYQQYQAPAPAMAAPPAAYQQYQAPAPVMAAPSPPAAYQEYQAPAPAMAAPPAAYQQYQAPAPVMAAPPPPAAYQEYQAPAPAMAAPPAAYQQYQAPQATQPAFPLRSAASSPY